MTNRCLLLYLLAAAQMSSTGGESFIGPGTDVVSSCVLDPPSHLHETGISMLENSNRRAESPPIRTVGDVVYIEAVIPGGRAWGGISDMAVR